ncbi:MAG: DUF177 domain-containing protein [Alphaproteobacteria bacterium]|nr:DUF177 domain-containing protein [Alphaproteobacteria bacterium]
MRVTLDSIPEEGLEIAVTTEQPWAVEGASSGVEGRVSALEGALYITRLDKEIRVRGELSATILRSCDRCVEDIAGVIGGELDLAYVPGRTLSAGTVDLNEDELDVGFYGDAGLDLSDVISEHFALLLPFRLSCDAPGFALADGQPCTWEPLSDSEEEEPVDPRFAALAKLSLDN